MLQALDWKTSARKSRMGDHWRILIWLVLGGITSTLTWHLCSPHTLWLEKLWAGMATGFAAGMVPGTIWQLRVSERWPSTSGWFIIMGFGGFGLFATIALLLIAPDLHAQEQQRVFIRSLNAEQISGISVTVDHHPTVQIIDARQIESFTNHTRHAELFYPSHEGSNLEFEITITGNDGQSWYYKGRIPERHGDDISFDFYGYLGWSEVIIPGGRQWLDSVSTSNNI
ncbi:MAG: hypothetical protein R3C45_21200 [Phycisphaerales bacterium]